MITDISIAADALLNAELVAIPTETVYGLAALATDEHAIKQVFDLKQRPLNHPLILHVAPEWDIRRWACEIPDYAHRFMQHFWPGPLTLVLPYRQGAVSPLVNSGQSSIAIRCPAHPLTLELLRQINTPLVAPSANPFGKVSPTTAEHVQKSFPDSSLTILNGGRCAIGIESTIVSALDPSGWQILRSGMISSEALTQLWKYNSEQSVDNVRVPGKMASHYQPEKPLLYFENPRHLLHFLKTTSKRVFVLHSDCPNQHPRQDFALIPEEPAHAARELYFQLRLADESSTDCIAIVLPDSSSATQGIRERILKAGRPFDE